jgi:chitinase
VESYYSGSIAELDSFDMKKNDHIIFCFGHLDGSRLKIDNAGDSALIKKMVSKKSTNPDLKVILSLGGWGGCETCSDAFFTKEGRIEFAKSVKELNDYFQTDGIDLDWEFPTVRLDNDIDQNPVHKTAPEDKKNFTDLVRILRKTLGKKTMVTVAAGGFQTFLEKAIEWKEVMKEVDFVNIMAYDLINGYATETGHHTALYSTPKQHESTDNAVQYLIKIGVNPKQIIIGSAFYARIWENVPPANNGLYQPGKFKQAVAYKDFPKNLTPAQGYAYFWDDTAKAPYMYNAAEKKFATFDDKRSIELKTKYVIDNKLGGIMYWELSNDTPQDGLLDVINKVKNAQ